MTDYDVTIVGSGMGGSILARVLRAAGRRVALVERHRHPRFALGESSTPLAALSLERLAAASGLEDLHHLATHGRWLAQLPDLRRGRKRGFTFYRHWNGSAEPPDRLLAAASPNDHTADAHWLRRDVDAHLVSRAATEGVEVLEETDVEAVVWGQSAVEVQVRQGKSQRSLRTAVIVDATGPGGLLHRALLLPPGAPLRSRSSLVAAHFEGVHADDGQDDDPYPAPWAAVHHLLDEGWVYELRFDHGVVSAGVLLRDPPTGPASLVWRNLLRRYPRLEAAYGDAKVVEPWLCRLNVQHRMAAAAGPRWIVLPNTFAFVDPLFSTGMAWTLLGIERIAALLDGDLDRRGIADGSEFQRYATLLNRECEHLDRLIAGAYRAMPDFGCFAAVACFYLAASSWCEARQRLADLPNPEWQGLLGADDPVLAPLGSALRRRAEPTHCGYGAELQAWLMRRLAPRDIAGIDRYAATRRIPVDLDVLLQRVDRLGCSVDTARERLPRLRG
ncbi:MAG: FAD-dependent oxidoreductase [Planctomycetota bacterium]